MSQAPALLSALRLLFNVEDGTLVRRGKQLVCVARGAFTAAASVVIDDATNNGIVRGLTVTHSTSGVPATGIGTGVLLRADVADGIRDAAALDAVATDVGTGSEDFDFVLKLRTAGAAIAEKLRLSSLGHLTVTGDLAAAGGFRQTVQFSVTNVAAGDNASAALSAPVQAQWAGAAAVTVGWVAPRAGSLTALSAALSAAAAGGDVIVGVYKNGTLLDATTIVTLASATSDTKARTTFAKDLWTFAAGDVIDVRLRAALGWSATSADLGVAVEIEC